MDMPINRVDDLVSTDTVANGAPVFEIIRPQQQTLPIVFASPHSGIDYSPEFIAASRLDPLTLRKSEDSFVDELFAAAPQLGAPLLRALFPRAYVDPNREPFELDPEMFVEALPDYTNTESPRVAAGLGTIARLVCSGAEIYDGKLHFAEALDRINRCYRPYHAALSQLIEETRALFGLCIVIDCHSMPSVGGPMDRDPGRKRVDFVLGDRHGAACDLRLTELVREILIGKDYVVRRNLPYAGAFTTSHYGVPKKGVHALQIEINRMLYMDEDRFEKSTGFVPLMKDITQVIAALGALKPESLAA